MATNVTLHIGAPKTGTTFLQTILFGNQSRLREHGILLPAKQRFHNLASAGVRNGPGSAQYRTWETLLSRIEAWPGAVLVSNEWFAAASEERATAAVQQLTDLAEVRLVATARDLVDQVPAAWQETLKVGESSQIDAFTAGLDRPQRHWCWAALDVAEVLDRWAPALPTPQTHVVTLPSPNTSPDALWTRFANACGIEPSWCTTDVNFARESLGVEAARLLQLAGPMLREAIDAEHAGWRAPYRWIQRYLAHGMLQKHRGRRITMSREQIAAVRDRSQRSVDRLRDRGHPVHGDLADLTCSTLPDGAVHPDTVDDSELLPIALQLVADLLGAARRSSAMTQQQPARSQPPVSPGADSPR